MKYKVIVYNDDGSEMKKIEVNGKIINEGNYWDFDLDTTLKDISKALKIDFLIKNYDSYS